jgi:hypothetical protein
MFGPDICGTTTKRVHVIFNYKGENKLIKKEISAPTDQLTHVFTLIVRKDNTYEVLIDGEKKESGKLEEDWDFLAPKTIRDPAVSKPADAYAASASAKREMNVCFWGARDTGMRIGLHGWRSEKRRKGENVD